MERFRLHYFAETAIGLVGGGSKGDARGRQVVSSNGPLPLNPSPPGGKRVGPPSQTRSGRIRNRQIVSQLGKTAANATASRPSQAGPARLCRPEGGTFSGPAAGARSTFKVLVRFAATAENTYPPPRHGCCFSHSPRSERRDTGPTVVCLPASLSTTDPVPPLGGSPVPGEARGQPAAGHFFAKWASVGTTPVCRSARATGRSSAGFKPLVVGSLYRRGVGLCRHARTSMGG
jgi:hypothetical protein